MNPNKNESVEDRDKRQPTKATNHKDLTVQVLKKVNQEQIKNPDHKFLSVSPSHLPQAKQSLFEEYIKTYSPEMWVQISDAEKNMEEYKPNKNTVALKGYYSRISSSSGIEKLRAMYLLCDKKRLYCCKSERHDPSAYIDILFAKQKIITNQDPDALAPAPYYGVRIIKNNKFEDIVHKEEKPIQDLITYLEEYVVLSQFANYYTQTGGLGAGKFGKVFEVYRNSDFKKFAIKVYNTERLYKDDLTLTVLYETNILRMVNNPNNKHCVKMNRIYEGNRYVYCVSELYTGGELLESMITQTSLSEYEALSIIQSIQKGLVYLASLQIVHRDIKPPNVVLRKENMLFDCVIIDLGCAIQVPHISRDNPHLKFCVGSPGYIAPEMLMRQPYDCEADVFSAGVTLYFMQHYEHPFLGTTKEEIIQKNIECDVDFDFNNMEGYNYEYSQGTIDLLKAMMAKNPKDRVTASEALQYPVWKLVAELDKDLAHKYSHDHTVKTDAKQYHTIIEDEETKKRKSTYIDGNGNEIPVDDSQIPDKLNDIESRNQSPSPQKIKKNKFEYIDDDNGRFSPCFSIASPEPKDKYEGGAIKVHHSEQETAKPLDLEVFPVKEVQCKISENDTENTKKNVHFSRNSKMAESGDRPKSQDKHTNFISGSQGHEKQGRQDICKSHSPIKKSQSGSRNTVKEKRESIDVGQDEGEHELNRVNMNANAENPAGSTKNPKHWKLAKLMNKVTGFTSVFKSKGSGQLGDGQEEKGPEEGDNNGIGHKKIMAINEQDIKEECQSKNN